MFTKNLWETKWDLLKLTPFYVLKSEVYVFLVITYLLLNKFLPVV